MAGYCNACFMSGQLQNPKRTIPISDVVMYGVVEIIAIVAENRLGLGFACFFIIAEALSTFGSMFAVFRGSGFLQYTAAIFFNTVSKLERYIRFFL